MPLLDFIRFMAVTDESPIGLAALEYCKAMVRVAPVRIASVSGGLVGAWEAMDALQMTPMTGAYVNAVCTHPSQWRQQLAVPMHKPVTEQGASDPSPERLFSPDGFARGDVSLYTEGVRNVLFVVQTAFLREPETPIQAMHTKEYLDELVRYEALVFNSPMPDLWRMLPANHPALMQVVGTPVLPDRRISIRHAILGNTATGGMYR